MQLTPAVQASFAQTTEASPASTVTVPVQLSFFVHSTSHVALVQEMGEAQAPGPPPLHWMLHAPDAVHWTPPSEQELSALHATVQLVPAHWTWSQLRLPAHDTTQELACVQSMSDWHVASFVQLTMHGTFGGHVTPALHGAAVVHVNTHAPAPEQTPPAAPHAAPQVPMRASASVPPSLGSASGVDPSFLVGSEASGDASGPPGSSGGRVATASIPHATTSVSIVRSGAAGG
jgi:hypothetical protein